MPSRDKPGFQIRLEAYFALHAQTLKDSWQRLKHTPLASTMTVLVIAIALTLPASFHALVQNLQQASAGFEATDRISLFLKPELSDEDGRKLAETLRKDPEIAGTELITKSAGLADLKTYSGFGDALEALDRNPLPAVVSITPTSTPHQAKVAQELLERLKALPEADFVQLDTEWLQKLGAMLAIADHIVLVFSVLLGLGVLFIVGNTIRLELQNRREEIEVAKLLGATNRFVRRPFLYAGFWYGVLGSGLAWFLVNLFLLWLRGPAGQLAELYGSPYTLSFLSVHDTCVLFGSAVLLGVVGAYVVVSHHFWKLRGR